MKSPFHNKYKDVDISFKTFHGT